MWWNDVLDVTCGLILDYLFPISNIRGFVDNPNSLALFYLGCFCEGRSSLSRRLVYIDGIAPGH
jgi:hypothetical protein